MGGHCLQQDTTRGHSCVNTVTTWNIWAGTRERQMQGHSWTRGGRAQKKAILSILFFQDEVTFFVIGDFYVIFGNFWWHFW